ncbi:MAG: AraC family transcriptional regulator [Clostridia bacterium]|nr:AraC family transcriptional regulator [Clostridia bacterium]
MNNDITIRDINIGVQSRYPIYFSHLRTNADITDQSFHLHDMLEIYVYVSGEVDFIIGDNYNTLRHGDILFTFPNELHRPVINGSAEYERFYITVPTDAFDGFDSVEKSPLGCFLEAKHTDNRAIELSDEERGAFLRLLGKISDCIAEDGDGYLAYSYFLRALHLLNSAKSITLPRDTNIPQVLRDVLAYISENYACLMTVSEIAGHFHVSSSYLSSIFSRYMKVGIKQYLQYKKISGAKIMLSRGANVTDVCFECGFNSCSHFISVFKETTGMTPNKYRTMSSNDV